MLRLPQYHRTLLLSLLFSCLFHWIAFLAQPYYAKFFIRDFRPFNVEIAWSRQELSAIGVNPYFLDAPSEEKIEEDFEEIAVNRDIPRFRDKHPKFKLKTVKKNEDPPSRKIEKSDTKPSNEKSSSNEISAENSAQELSAQSEEDDEATYPMSEEDVTAIRANFENIPRLGEMAPGNAKIIAIIHSERLQSLELSADISRLLRAFPDFALTLGKSDFDPLRDFSQIFIASSNPALYAGTFLAVESRIDADALSAAIDQSFPVPVIWRNDRGAKYGTPDPDDKRFAPSSGIYKRKFYFMNPYFLAYGSQEVINDLNNSLMPFEEDKGEIQTKMTKMQAISALCNTDSERKPAFFLFVRDVKILSLPSATPLPASVLLSVVVDRGMNADIRLSFENAEKAEAFLELWPDTVDEIASALPVPGLSSGLSALTFAIDRDNPQNIYGNVEINAFVLKLIFLFTEKSLPSLNR